MSRTTYILQQSLHVVSPLEEVDNSKDDHRNRDNGNSGAGGSTHGQDVQIMVETWFGS